MEQAQNAQPGTQTRGREFVRSFLFSVKIDSPLAHLHVMTKLLAIIAVSLVIVRFIETDDPDPIGAISLMVLAFFGLYLAGVLRWIFQSYLLVLFPALISMAITWVIFNPAKENILLRIPVYSGHIRLGVSVGLALFVISVVGWYLFRKEVFWGIVIGIGLVVVVDSLFGNPSLTLTEFDFFHPLTIRISRQSSIVAVTKALGYGAMIFVSLILVMTTRDIELTGTMMQLRVPYVASFFVATMLRSLGMALDDHSTIRQAQIARGVSLKKKNMLQVIRDLAYMAVPLTATMLRRSSEVGDAVLIRGFNMQTKAPTEFHEIRSFTPADWVILVICVVFMVGVIGFGWNFTKLVGVAL